ncbi:C4-dicarboxylate transport protein [Kineosphaera limosa NBRC 100340]|uniref:C4-dicarboxylate transport protein n=1 Tax=Kineosphaera limosa NBRC 100340 TaxID=1184609 RepID=K6VKH5_9MICO|nr:C4-dicarboxylate transport protein [Kineosphaera limosa NBRC 100340]
MVAGIVFGLVAPEAAKEWKVLGTLFVSLIKMMISPVIFCTIVLGIGSVRAAASVGKAGGIALAYFITMSTFALAIGLMVGNMIQPGHGLTITPGSGAENAKKAEGAGGTVDFIAHIIPETLFSSVVSGSVLQTLFVALLVGFAVQRMGKQGEPILAGVAHLQKLVFRILTMVLWVAPIGAFGAIAGVVGESGSKAVGEMLKLMGAFYLTCALFIIFVLGGVLWIVTRTNIFKLLKYLAREYLLIVATSSSESALPNLMAKMEHVGVSKPTVGVVVPTGYSFNLDGTAIYLTMSAIFIADAMNMPMSLGEQVGLLLFMIVASKGAAGVSGAGLATLAGGLQAHAPQLLDGVGVIVGIDRFMSEARALTNFSGNAVATILVGRWTNTIDLDRVHHVLDGGDPFDYATMTDDHGVSAEDTRVELGAHPPAPVNPADNLQPTPQVVLQDYPHQR